MRINKIIKYLEKTYTKDYPVDSVDELQILFDEIRVNLLVAKTVTPEQVEKYIAKNEKKIGDREQFLAFIKDKISVLEVEDLKVLSHALLALYHLTTSLSQWDTRKEQLRELAKDEMLTNKRWNSRGYDYYVCNVANYYKEMKELYKGA